MEGLLSLTKRLCWSRHRSGSSECLCFPFCGQERSGKVSPLRLQLLPFNSLHSVFLKPQTRRCWTNSSVNTKGTPTLNSQQWWSQLSSSNTTRAKWSTESRSVTQLVPSSCFQQLLSSESGIGEENLRGSTERFWRGLGPRRWEGQEKSVWGNEKVIGTGTSCSSPCRHFRKNLGICSVFSATPQWQAEIGCLVAFLGLFCLENPVFSSSLAILIQFICAYVSASHCHRYFLESHTYDSKVDPISIHASD